METTDILGSFIGRHRMHRAGLDGVRERVADQLARPDGAVDTFTIEALLEAQAKVGVYARIVAGINAMQERGEGADEQLAAIRSEAMQYVLYSTSTSTSVVSNLARAIEADTWREVYRLIETGL